MAAQPFRAGPACGQRDRLGRARVVEPARRQRGEADEQGGRPGKPAHDEGDHPAKAHRIHQQRLADPVEADEEVAEAPPPAGRKAGKPWPAPVDHPHQPGQPDDQEGERIQRREGQAGKCAQQEGQPAPAPAAQGGDPARPAGQQRLLLAHAWISIIQVGPSGSAGCAGAGAGCVWDRRRSPRRRRPRDGSPARPGSAPDRPG